MNISVNRKKGDKEHEKLTFVWKLKRPSLKKSV